jgi:cytochrome c553
LAVRRSRTPTSIRRIVPAIAAALLLAASAQAQSGDPARGAANAALCNACHGEGGNSSMAGVPALAGQPENYLVSQMILFREGLRKVPAMNAALANLDEKTIVDLAAYYAKQAPVPAPDATTKRNAALYERGALISRSASCGGCHLPDYRGRENMPRLAGQREDYLASTMIEYRDNRRVGADTTMTGLLYGISDADVKALAHYLAQQR